MGIQDIIILFFLTRKIGILAIEKKQDKFTWQAFTVIAWLIGILIGVMIGMRFFGPKNVVELTNPNNITTLLSVMICGYLGAVSGYHLVLSSLKNKPVSN
jgi:DMSO reductase anchor subunit